MTRPPFFALVVIGLALGVDVRPARAQEWTVVREAVSVAGAADVLETVWTVSRPPGGPADRIELHRYRTAGPSVATLFYLPGTNMNGEVAVADEDHNLWLFLARRGLDVFALDYRTRFVPADALSDSRFMREWTMDTFVADARAALAKAREVSGRPASYLAGFSRGVSLAYAVAASETPDAVAGLVALDGPFKRHAPKNEYDFAAAQQKLDASGAFASDVAGRLGWESRQALMTAAAANPAAPATDGKSASIGDQVALLLHGAWGPGGLANPLGGMSRPRILARLLAGYDRYYPAVQDLDGRAIGDREDDPRTAIDDRWGELTLPVLYFGATGMGADWLLDGIYSAAKSGSKDVTLNVLERYGHLDVVVGEHARREVFEPTLEWIWAHAVPDVPVPIAPKSRPGARP